MSIERDYGCAGSSFRSVMSLGSSRHIPLPKELIEFLKSGIYTHFASNGA